MSIVICDKCGKPHSGNFNTCEFCLHAQIKMLEDKINTFESDNHVFPLNDLKAVQVLKWLATNDAFSAIFHIAAREAIYELELLQKQYIKLEGSYNDGLMMLSIYDENDQEFKCISIPPNDILFKDCNVEIFLKPKGDL